jgi:hypothetical protein
MFAKEPPMTANVSTEKVIHALADRAQLTDLVSLLGACIDEHRFDELAELFTEDVSILTPGGPATGREAVVAQAARNHAEFDRLQHNVSGVLVEFDGADRAGVRANLVGVFGRSDQPLPVRVLGGRYRFEAVRTAQGWKFADMRVEAIWRTDGEGAAAATERLAAHFAQSANAAA